MHPEPSRTRSGVVVPTRTDPFARAASTFSGGPLGHRALTGHSWWSPLRIVLAVATVVFGLGVVQKSPCVVTDWEDAAQPLPFSHMCYSDISYLYVGRGLAEGVLPYQPVESLPGVKQPVEAEDAHQYSIEYPVLTGVWMGATGFATRLIGRAPDVSDRTHDEVASDVDVQFDGTLFWGVNAVGFFVVLLMALTLLVYAQRRRPWDALFVAASPALALTAMINWDLLVVGLVAGFLWAWSTRRPLLAGVFIGLGTATKLFPLFFLGPLLVLCWRERMVDSWLRVSTGALAAWLAVNLPVYYWSPEEYLWFWRFNADRGPDFGSLWLVASDYGHSASPHVINVSTAVLFGLACLGVALLGLFARRRPRLVQLLFLVVASFLLVNKVYSPQYVLWLLPLAALARPRWRDLLIWQACEVFYFFAVWMHIGNFFVAEGANDWAYALATLVRVAGLVFLMGVVVRDIVEPAADPVRRDGLSDDPLGGVLDRGIDATKAPRRTRPGAGSAGGSSVS